MRKDALMVFGKTIISPQASHNETRPLDFRSIVLDQIYGPGMIRFRSSKQNRGTAPRGASLRPTYWTRHHSSRYSSIMRTVSPTLITSSSLSVGSKDWTTDINLGRLCALLFTSLGLTGGVPRICGMLKDSKRMGLGRGAGGRPPSVYIVVVVVTVILDKGVEGPEVYHPDDNALLQVPGLPG